MNEDELWDNGYYSIGRLKEEFIHKDKFKKEVEKILHSFIKEQQKMERIRNVKSGTNNKL